jgi:hypothetical protein
MAVTCNRDSAWERAPFEAVSDLSRADSPAGGFQHFACGLQCRRNSTAPSWTVSMLATKRRGNLRVGPLVVALFVLASLSLASTASGAMRVFVTSTYYDGALGGGLLNADSECQRLAGLASLPGHYIAWLSTSSSNASDRLIQSSGPYVLVDGTVIANDWADLVDGSLAHAIDLDENGSSVSWYAWTGTYAYGTVDFPTCNEWTDNTATYNGTIGDETATNSDWSALATSFRCDAHYNLYCFQQPDPPPTISKTFGAASIPVGGSTSLTFTITNPNSFSLSGISFSDTLPAGLVVATPNGLGGTCVGTVTADAGTNSISLNDGTLGASSSCTISLNVTGISAGVQTNTTSAITSNESDPGGTASATINVILPVPTMNEWGMIIFVVLAGLGSVYYLRRRRRARS